VNVDPGSPYAVDALYDGARFPSQVLRSPEHVTIRVAHATESARHLRVSVESVAVVGDPSAAQAVHAMTIRNTGRDAFTGSLRLPLLPGATVVQEGDGLDRRFLRIDDTKATPSMVSTLPILPGSHDLTYTYVVQMTRSGVRLARTTTLPTDRFELLVGGKLAATGRPPLEANGKVKLGPRGDEKTYTRLVATNLDKEAAVSAQIDEATNSGTFTAVVAAAAGIIVLALFAIPLLRRRRRIDEPPAPVDEPSSTSV
jgi:hypothetical protein